MTITRTHSTAFGVMRAVIRACGRAALNRHWYVFDSLSSEYSKSFFYAFLELKDYERACKRRGHEPRLWVSSSEQNFPGYVCVCDGEVVIAECFLRG